MAFASRASHAARVHPVATYLAFAFGITFTFRVPLALSSAGLLPLAVPRSFQLLGDLGPALAAIIVARMRGRVDLRELLARLSPRRAPAWAAVALLLPAALVAAAAAVSLALGGRGLDLARLGRWEELPDLAPLATWGTLVLFIGVGEELGWRGWMQQRLQDQHPLPTAGVLVGLAWVAWHAPSFVFDPEFRGWGIAYRAGWAALLVVGSVLYATMYEAARGSVFVVALFHGTSDWLLASEGARDPALNYAWASLVVLLTVAMLVARARRASAPVAIAEASMLGPRR